MNWIHFTWGSVFAYLLIAGISVVLALFERSQRRTGSAVSWPAFWYVEAAALTSMAAVRAGDASHSFAGVGRHVALSGGLYDGRRSLQALAVVAIGLVWTLSMCLAARRVGARCRNLAPVALLTITLTFFGGIRAVSLHQIDALMSRGNILRINVGDLIELALLIGLLTAIAIHFQQTIAGRVVR